MLQELSHRKLGRGDAEDGAAKRGREGIREVRTSHSKAFILYQVLTP